MLPLELITRWRARAADLERFAPPAGLALRECADELERAMQDGSAESLSLSQAAAQSGFHPDSLSRMIRRGALQNVGTSSRPRVLVSELPFKAGQVRRPSLQVSAVANGGLHVPTSTADMARDAVAGRIRPA